MPPHHPENASLSAAGRHTVQLPPLFPPSPTLSTLSSTNTSLRTLLGFAHVVGMRAAGPVLSTLSPRNTDPKFCVPDDFGVRGSRLRLTPIIHR
jgi:hypothetical protein